MFLLLSFSFSLVSIIFVYLCIVVIHKKIIKCYLERELNKLQQQKKQQIVDLHQILNKIRLNDAYKFK